jgi:putative hydrolase of the HAD superfamily
MNSKITRLPSAVLFDLDDTLFDHRYSARRALEDLQSRHPILEKHSLEFLVGEDLRLLGEKHPLVLAGTLSIADSRIQRMQGLFAACGTEIGADEAQYFADRRQKTYREMRRAVPGAIPLLQQLKGRVKIGIVTNNFREEQRDKLDACGLTDFIDVLVTSEEVLHAKPDRRIFESALEQLGCNASQAVMVGDSWEFDILGAWNARLRSIWFNRVGAEQPSHPQVREITSLEPPDVIAEQILQIRLGHEV